MSNNQFDEKKSLKVLSNEINNGQLKVKIKRFAFISYNVFGFSDEKKDLVVKKIKDLFPDREVTVSSAIFERYRGGYNSNISFRLDLKYKNEIGKIREKVLEAIKEFDDDIVKKRLKCVKNLEIDLDYDEFYKKQPEKILLSGLIYLSDKKDKESDKAYDKLKIVLIPNPRYVKGTIQEYDEVWNYFNYKKFRTDLQLPYPKVEGEEFKTRIITEPSYCTDIVAFQLLIPQMLSVGSMNEKSTKRVCPAILSCFSLRESKNETSEVSLDNQTMPSDSIFWLLYNSVRFGFVKKYMDSNESGIDLKKTLDFLEKYFYSCDYDEKTFDKIPNIMISPVEGTNYEFNSSIRGEKTCKPKEINDNKSRLYSHKTFGTKNKNGIKYKNDNKNTFQPFKNI